MDQTDVKTMAPLWKSMVSKNSPMYKESLWSSSLSREQTREAVLLRMRLERDRGVLLRQLKQ